MVRKSLNFVTALRPIVEGDDGEWETCFFLRRICY